MNNNKVNTKFRIGTMVNFKGRMTEIVDVSLGKQTALLRIMHNDSSPENRTASSTVKWYGFDHAGFEQGAKPT